MKQFLTGASFTWQGVYARFNTWRKKESWQTVWLHELRLNKAHLDYSSVQMDGSHTPAKNDGETVGYQCRKKVRTTTTLFLVDSWGQPLPYASLQASNQHESYGLKVLFEERCALLEAAGIPVAGLSLKNDKIFYNNELRQEYAARNIEANTIRNCQDTDWLTDDDPFFDPERYRCCVVAKHANAWLCGFKTLLMRYETSVGNWLAWH